MYSAIIILVFAGLCTAHPPHVRIGSVDTEGGGSVYSGGREVLSCHYKGPKTVVSVAWTKINPRTEDELIYVKNADSYGGELTYGDGYADIVEEPGPTGVLSQLVFKKADVTDTGVYQCTFKMSYSSQLEVGELTLTVSRYLGALGVSNTVHSHGRWTTFVGHRVSMICNWPGAAVPNKVEWFDNRIYQNSRLMATVTADGVNLEPAYQSKPIVVSHAPGPTFTTSRSRRRST
jgi:hypothetical protein